MKDRVTIAGISSLPDAPIAMASPPFDHSSPRAPGRLSGMQPFVACATKGCNSPAGEPRISIIIPALNEAATLEATLAAIQSDIAHELLVVDAASSDETAGIAQRVGARIVRSHRRQRAHQLNLGAQHAVADVLLFLHADTLLPPRGLEAIAHALRLRETMGGAFARNYASASLFLRATCSLARLRNHTIGWHLGDQAMFVRRSAFFQLGGFREVDQFEDLDFSRRLKRFGRIVTLAPGVTSSSRRFQRGAIRTSSRDFGLTIRYLLEGLPPAEHPSEVSRTALI